MLKRNKIIYWIATTWLSLGMVSTGVVQLMKRTEGPGGAAAMASLGYPPYVGALLGVLKLMGVIILLMPRAVQLKEWAYAGFAFLMVGAAYSHIAVSDEAAELFPCLLLLALTLVSWYFRQGDRKFVPQTNKHL